MLLDFEFNRVLIYSGCRSLGFKGFWPEGRGFAWNERLAFDIVSILCQIQSLSVGYRCLSALLIFSVPEHDDQQNDLSMRQHCKSDPQEQSLLSQPPQVK